MNFFNVLIFIFLFSSCVSSKKNLVQYEEEKRLHPYAVMQGLTTEKESVIRIIAKQDEALEFKVFRAEEEISTIKFSEIKAGETGFVIHKLFIQNLDQDLVYTLQILKNKSIIDQRRFQSVNLKMAQAKIGVLSCTHDIFVEEQFQMWNEYLNQNPSYTFMIGDNVYADRLISASGGVYKFKFASEEQLWTRYIQTFNTLYYLRSSRLVPTLGIWDDHDYGFNNGGESYPYKKESLKVFNAFYGVEDIPKSIIKLEGAGYVFSGFDQNFIFIDGRSFRSEPKSPLEKQTHWGDLQAKKIFGLLKNDNKTSWLIQGDQFFGAYHEFESFEKGHPENFKVTLEELKTKKSPVWFISGDRHLNELMMIEPENLGYETYELTSSAMHASVFPDAWKKKPNPRQIAGASGVHNYSIVEILDTKKREFKISSYTKKMKLLYEKTIEINKK